MTERLNVEASVNTIFDVSQMSSVVLGWVDRLTLKSTIVGDPESPGKTSLCFRKKIDILSLFIKSSDYIDGLVYYQSMERLVRFKEEAVVHTRETCFYADSKTVGMQDEEEIWSLNSSDLPSYKETRRTLTRKFSLLVKGELDTAAQVHWAIPIIFNEKVLKLRNGEEEKSLEPLEVSGGLFFFSMISSNEKK